ncbi:hypothetical protein [Bradyrhizobium sp. SZCCHNS3004]|uniref:hypothetical protein n=2 Tax=Bradyrhizobium TaxID=374 RepID=UPI00291657B1|nr:hypothetical protein [Bradyrhizobium sp. SZCCHNS3004]
MRDDIAISRSPTTHNGLVAGSSPAGPTKNISILLGLRRRRRDYRTRNRTRYVHFSFVCKFAHRNPHEAGPTLVMVNAIVPHLSLVEMLQPSR